MVALEKSFADLAERKAPLRPFPPQKDLGFNKDPGFTDDLAALCERARIENCNIEDVLIAEGHYAETEFYKRLADFFDLPFLAFPIRLSRAINPHEALSVGLAPVDDDSKPRDEPRFLYAPQGARLASIINQLNTRLRLQDSPIAITTPTRFRTSVRATFGDKIASAATHHLYRTAPLSCARTLRPALWIAALLGFVALILISLISSPGIWYVALLMMSCFPFLPGLVVKIMALRNTRSGDRAAPFLPDCDLPYYSILVPIYREAAVLEQLVASLSALDYPRSKLDIKLLIEADDIETLGAFESIVLPRHFDVLICPRGVPRTKPRALTIGLAYTKSEFVVVYDAEDHPEPDQLKKAAAIFAASHPNLACLQARITIDNLHDSWITRQFALEYAALFDVLLPGLAHLDQPVPLGGTSNHFRRAALEKIGAWDPWNVTEDADLGLRLFRAGYQVKTFNSTTHEEAPVTLKAWSHQRTRWQKGWMQTAAVHLRHHGEGRDRMDYARWIMLILMASVSPLSILLHPSLLLGLDLMIRLSHGIPATSLPSVIFLVLYFISFIFDMMIAIRGAIERKIKINVADLLGIIPYSHMKTWAAWRGMFELLYAPYHWRKTEHGFAKTSRRLLERIH